MDELQESQFVVFFKRVTGIIHDFMITRLVWLLLFAGVLSLGPIELSSKESKRVLFFGDSLTAGYGLSPELAYPALIQRKIEDAGYTAEVTVGAVSGDTSAGGLRRIDWMLRRPVDVFVLALGANDGLRGIDSDSTRSNLQAIIRRVRGEFPEVRILIAGMQLPPSMGHEYTDVFAQIFPDIAQENEAVLIPFLLEGVGGIAELNLADRIHPNRKGHEMIADTVWRFLEPEVR